MSVMDFARRSRRPDPEIAGGDPSVPRHLINDDGLRARSERERLPPALPPAPLADPTRAIEAELGEYIATNRATLASATEGPLQFDPQSPPERAVEIANLVTSGYETYVLDLRKERADIIAQAARHVFQIDMLIEDLSLARDRIAQDHMDFMHMTRNGVAAVIEARRIVAGRPRVPAQAEERNDDRDEQATAANDGATEAIPEK